MSEEDSCQSTKEEYVKNYIGCTRNCKTSSTPAWMCTGPSTTGCICKYPYFKDEKSGKCVDIEDCHHLKKRDNHLLHQFGPNIISFKFSRKGKTKYNKYPWGFSGSYTITTSGKIYSLRTNGFCQQLST